MIPGPCSGARKVTQCCHCTHVMQEANVAIYVVGVRDGMVAVVDGETELLGADS